MGYIVDENGHVISEDSKRSNKPYSKIGSKQSSEGSIVYARIFGYMFAGIAITAVASFLFGFILSYLLSLGGNTASATSTIYLILMIASIIGVIVLNFVITRRVMITDKSLVGPLITYCVMMGFMLSTFTIYIDWRVLGTAFGLTALIIGLLALVSLLLKNHMRPLIVLASGLALGVLFIYPLYLILSLFVSDSTYVAMYMGLSGILFVFMLIITVIDIARIGQIAERGGATRNVELYCAFTIYLDFIYIFIRMVYFILMFANRRR